MKVRDQYRLTRTYFDFIERWRKRSLDHTSVTNGHSFRGMVYYGVEPLWATQRYEQDKKRFKS